VGGNEYDCEGRCLFGPAGNEVPLTRSECALLEALINGRGRVLSRDYLLTAVSGRGAEPYDRAIDVLVSRLRRKIEADPRHPQFILTVAGAGYKFVGQMVAKSPKVDPATRQITPEGSKPIAKVDPQVKNAAAAPHSAAGRLTMPERKLWRLGYLGIGAATAVVIATGLGLAIFERPSPSPVPRLSIVVLPFVNLGANPSQDYLADVITDELTASLSRMRGAFVIARSTAASYKGKAIDVKAIGKELGVRYVLEGSEQHDGSDIRVSAQLVDAETGVQFWVDQIDTARNDLVQMQETIVTRLARALQTELVFASAARMVRAHNEDADAEDLAMRCEASSFYGGTNVLSDTGYTFCERALQRDPDNVRALSNMAFRFVARAAGGESADRAADLQRADELVSKALSIERSDYLALFVKALVLERQGHLVEASVAAERCLDANPSFVVCIFAIGRNHVFRGEPERAIENIERAFRLSPHDDFLNLFCHFKAQALWMLHRDEEAIEWWRRSIAINPEFPIVHLFLTATLATTGRKVEAEQALQRYLALPRRRAETIAEVAHDYPIVSESPLWRASRERLLDGLRIAGLPAS
jgi:TolB-like protein/DNA-binding winged helix-turn-helix (wHTH) protein/Flp pilus assembly protein TadD